MKISATIITLNEERNIARCIDSLVHVADEILVMDSGSTDRTKEICMEKGVTFFHQPWLGYAQQKNCLNQKASFDMILSIDADEAVSPELQAEIISIKQNYVRMLVLDWFKYLKMNGKIKCVMSKPPMKNPITAIRDGSCKLDIPEMACPEVQPPA